MENIIIDAIKNDDVKVFESQIKSKEDFALCFGKFPLLSICYLYNSKKIIRKYEKNLITVGEYKIVEGYPEINRTFRKKAKKSIRFFTDDEVIDPIVILAILEKSEKLERVFPIAKKTKKDIAVIPKIYELLFNKLAKRNGNELILPAKALSNKQKTIVIMIIAMTMVIMAVAIISPIMLINEYGEGSVINPYKVYNEEQFFEAMNKNGNIVLMNDIIITNNTEIKKYSAILDGNGKTLNLASKGSRLISNLTGSINNIKFDFGDFSQILTNSDALLIFQNDGNLTNINISINGTFTERSTEQDYLFSLFCCKNNGLIANCDIKGKLMFTGDGNKNAYFGGFAALNYGVIQNCVINKNTVIDADTMDIAGIVIENEKNGVVKNCVNFANFTQNSSISNWSPNISGITYNNLGKIDACSNIGNLSVSTSNVNKDIINNIILAGIAYNNSGNITNSENNGELTAFSTENDVNTIAIISGITINNGGDNGEIDRCKNNGILSAKIKNGGAKIAGIAAINYQNAMVTNSGNTAKMFSLIEDKKENFVAIGGIAVQSVVTGKIENCFSYAELDYVNGSLTTNYIGGILSMGFSGDINFEINNYYLVRDNIELGIAVRQKIVNKEIQIVKGDNIGVTVVSSMEELEKTEVFW